jgi:GNAT superfamily N-acetyltransferase
MDSLTYRRYEKGDLEAITELTKQAWPVVYKFAEGENATLLAKSYVLSNLNSANYTHVCVDGDKIVGFLIANMKHCKGDPPDPSGSNRKLIFDYLRGKYGRFRKRFHMLFAQIAAFYRTESICKKFDAEILLFVVDANYRGHGIGTTLMNTFLATARQNGEKTVFLATDVLCNRLFYERLGFIKYGDFYDDCLSLLMGKPSHTDIYLMPLTQT